MKACFNNMVKYSKEFIEFKNELVSTCEFWNAQYYFNIVQIDFLCMIVHKTVSHYCLNLL